MKTILRLTVLALSVITSLCSCRTVDGPSPARRSTGTEKTTYRDQSAMPHSYYKHNTEGSYYYTTEADEQTNADYRPTVRRNVSSDGGY